MKNAGLITPRAEYLQSFLEACREFKAQGGGTDSFFEDPDKFHDWKGTLFAKFEDGRLGRNLPAGYVPASMFWLVEGGDFIGEGNIGSARVMEKNGGVYQDTIDNVIDGKARRTKRYWVDTGGE